MKTDLLGKTNLTLIDHWIGSQQQSLLFTANQQSEISLALDYIKRQIEQQKAEYFVIKPDKNAKIKIDQVRDALEKTIVSPQNKRFFLIFDCDTMLAGAQNALLKELEEPKNNFFFFLFTAKSAKLLATIRSRTQQVKLETINPQIIMKYFAQHFINLTPQQLQQIAFLAENDLELWQELASNENSFKKWLDLANLAKQILTSRNSYQKLTIVYQVPKEREEAINFVKLVLKICHQTMQKQASDNLVQISKNWLVALDRLNHNCAVRLSLAAAIL